MKIIQTFIAIQPMRRRDLTYNRFVNIGSYLIVEDSNINGHPTFPDFGPGPMEALKRFIKDNKNFVIDKSKERFMMTLNPNGYLKKIS
ncbi:MAG: CmcI family methyltransferase [Alphaproteobacteria bacterium]